MTTTRANSPDKSRFVAYEQFTGLDTSRDVVNMDTGTGQALVDLNNGFCDQRGQIVRDAGVTRRTANSRVKHIAFFSKDQIAYTEVHGDGTHFISETGIESETVYPANVIATTTVFNRELVFAVRGLPPLIYTGNRWRTSTSTHLNTELPAYCTTVRDRACFAGLKSSSTKILISEDGNLDKHADDTDPNSESALRAGTLDIRNLLGTADEITGLSSFEQDKLVIFASDRVFVFQMDPDISRIELDTETNVGIGCASHNTIQQAGTDLLYCSRSGVFALRRVSENGLQVGVVKLSERIDLEYRRLFQQVEDPETITAVYDRDEQQYHVYFPLGGGGETTRLTMTFVSGEGGLQTRWSSSDFLNATCGAFLFGNFVVGTPFGIYTVGKIEDEDTDTPTLTAKTPVLWTGPFDSRKQSKSILIQAFGDGELQVEAQDENGRDLGAITVQLTEADDSGRRSVPLSAQYLRPFEHRYRGLQLTFNYSGKGLFRIIGVAVELRS
jgi:hypothetical protein